jgi:hypothetical protein
MYTRYYLLLFCSLYFTYSNSTSYGAIAQSRKTGTFVGVRHPTPPPPDQDAVFQLTPEKDCLELDFWCANLCQSFNDPCSVERCFARIGATFCWPAGLIGGCILGCIKGAVRTGPQAYRKEHDKMQARLAEIRIKNTGYCKKNCNLCCQKIEPCLECCCSPAMEGSNMGCECCQICHATVCCDDYCSEIKLYNRMTNSDLRQTFDEEN